MNTFALPDLGEGLHEAEIVAWHVAEGDHVVADQPLVSVETDKAVVEVPAPHAGHIARLFGKPGDRIEIGAPLVQFAEGAAKDAGAIVGSIEEAGTGPASPRPVARAATGHPAAPAAMVKAMPAVRALARRLGIDLVNVIPTGPQGQITAADVEAAVQRAPLADGFEPLRGVRRAMAENMMRSGAEVVPATVTDEANVQAWRSDADVTLRLIRALVAGCRAEPALNAWYDGKRVARRLHQNIDLGIAVDTDDGLFAPVLTAAGERAPADLRRGLDALKADVRARTVPHAALRGQTITLSNFGGVGGQHAMLVVVPPQVAILGAGRIGDRAVADSGKPAVRRMLPLSLTFDHRAVTGGEAGRFLVAVIRDLERAE